MTAYIIGRMIINDEATYAEFSKRARPIIEQYGGRFLARGGRAVTLEGRAYDRNVIVAFPTMEQAEALYNSPEYKDVWDSRRSAATRAVVVVEGLDEVP